MNKPRFYVRSLGFATCFWLVVTLVTIADEPKQHDVSAISDESGESVDARLAEIRLKLARLELKSALDTNKQMAGFYSTFTVVLLQRNVAVAETTLREILRNGDTNSHAAHLRELEANVKIAELKYQVAVQLTERVPQSGFLHKIPADSSRVERTRLRLEAARVALARARDFAHVATPLDHLRWQLEQLRQEVLNLTLRVEELSQRN